MRCGAVSDAALMVRPRKPIFEAEEINPMPHARVGHVAAAVGAKIFVFGGRGENGEPVLSVDLLRFKRRTWESLSVNLPNAVVDATAFVHDGRIFIVGGRDGEDNLITGVTLVFDPDTRSFSSINTVPNVPRMNAGAARVKNFVYLFGGYEDSALGITNVVERFDGESWTILEGHEFAAPRASFAVAEYRNRIWIVGGFNGDGVPVGNVDYFYPAKNTKWKDYDDFEPRAKGAAGVLFGRLYIFGGLREETAGGYQPTDETDRIEFKVKNGGGGGGGGGGPVVGFGN
eukprot:CAMPEP_0202090494 /NCGR_PEP_ID=MMETSP0964-20121228/43712_1 /ASSEMBLY_ACC=CAM_ASM_000500 /TAXON_ID=4773 /ORGANISM="Schizochytrium aggregatum, Strain ATCC28209" /LENGTH=286 /DNA_ID=CAMNT_0048658655 /DNA_START=1 /DNA_END=861 /DNA_ORIENTATION=+